MQKIIYTIIAFAAAILPAAAQKDSVSRLEARIPPGRVQPYHYNVIKWNPTPMLLWSKNNVTISYERIFKRHPNKSITLTVGYFEAPTILGDTIGNFLAAKNVDKYGFNVSAEFRFYLSKQNRRPAPSGIYIAPFVWYWQYHFSNHLSLVGEPVSGDFTADIRALNLGVVLGYQFVFAKRFTLDFLLMGPSVAFYSHDNQANITVPEKDREQINKDLEQALEDRFPAINTLIRTGQLNKLGSNSTFSFGFRYSIQFGFHF